MAPPPPCGFVTLLHTLLEMVMEILTFVEKLQRIRCVVLSKAWGKSSINAWVFCRAGHSLLFPYSLFALPLLQHLFSLSLLRYFSENCNTLLAIRYRYFCFISVADCINFRATSSVKDPQH
jgi:hypothetical protein